MLLVASAEMPGGRRIGNLESIRLRSGQVTNLKDKGIFLVPRLRHAGARNVEKIVDNPGSNIVILMYWRFFEQRMILEP
jgi:hypothetical protein